MRKRIRPETTRQNARQEKPAFNKRAGKVFALDYGRLMGDYGRLMGDPIFSIFYAAPYRESEAAKFASRIISSAAGSLIDQ